MGLGDGEDLDPAAADRGDPVLDPGQPVSDERGVDLGSIRDCAHGSIQMIDACRWSVRWARQEK